MNTGCKIVWGEEGCCWKFSGNSKGLGVRVNFRDIEFSPSNCYVMDSKCVMEMENHSLVSEVFTPRGLCMEVSTSIYCINGRSASLMARTCALLKAYQVEGVKDELIDLEIAKSPSPIKQATKIPILDMSMSDSLVGPRPLSSRAPVAREFRNVLSEVIEDKLFLGSCAVAKNFDLLKSRNIRNILNVARDFNTSETFIDNKLPSFIASYESLFLKDSKDQRILEVLPFCIQYIDLCMSQGGKVLVHCVEGVSRSASIIIAYVMWKNRISFRHAEELICSIRPICSPNQSFICQLRDFEDRIFRKKDERSIADGIYQVCLHDERIPELFILVKFGSKLLRKDCCYVYKSGERKFLFLMNVVHGPIEANANQARTLVEREALVDRLKNFDFKIVSSIEDLNLEVARNFRYRAATTPRDSFSPVKIEASPVIIRKPLRIASLFEYPNLTQSIPQFDVDDLVSISAYVLIVTTTTGNELETIPECYVWIGRNCTIETDEILKRIDDTLQLSNPTVVREGFEHGNFWEFF